MIRSPLSRGFSLVEVLIYLGVFLIIVTSSVGFVLSLDQLLDEYRVETALYRSGTQVMEHMLVTIRQGDQVNQYGTIQDSAADGRLLVANQASTTAMIKSGDDLLLEVNGIDYGSLLPNTVSVSGFTVHHYPRTEGEFVRVILELTATIDTTVRTQTYYGGAVVRGSE